MNKLFPIILALILLLSMNAQVFAAATNNDSDTTPIIRSENYDHIIDTTEIMSFLEKIDNKEKRDILEAYFFMPVTVTESNNKAPIDTAKVSQEAKELANLSVADLKLKYKSLMKQKVKEIKYSENVLATPYMKEYLQQNEPDLVNSLHDKWADSETVISNNIEFDTTNEFSTMSIVPMNYYKALSYDSLAVTVLWASCNVDWNYDSSTKKITSLLPTTNFWYTGVSPWYHILDPQGLYKNTQFIKPNSTGDRGFVQKGRLILWQDGGAYTPISMFKFNLVFSPSATTTSKMLLNDTGCPPTNIVADPVNWGGGY
ncbi:hypothetical protein [Sinanaerobacter chloroacetimidivorans]|uniref:Uncharacterized protein n=1 Tax=Sinanaerobacter chloroacetimidivorans TaxID=2818044 RepID=A0A8J7W340_9FIRM|nr:hypothetical protein [Sinanaerobacter chloroacetimidivorans]MBR0599599.1 hypothetical protein [Sinanaerobacter chloroacetimidivorans]